MLKLTDRPILVLGDLILDEYIKGTATRLSPEAPVPVVNIKDSEYRLGGAANVAANIRALGGNPITIGVLGDDNEAHQVAELFRIHGMSTAGLIRTDLRRTTTKTRIMVNRQQIVRLDKENTHCVDQKTESDLNWRVQALAKGCAAVIISDYAKGFITPSLMTTVVYVIPPTTVPIFIDPKIQNAISYYGLPKHAITCMTPNLQEAQDLNSVHLSLRSNLSIEDAGNTIIREYGCQYVLITRGEDGMTLVEDTATYPPTKQPYSAHHLPTAAQEVFDVSGAGDTVIAILALARVSGMEMLDAAKIANIAAGIVVGKSGTATVSLDELCTAIGE